MTFFLQKNNTEKQFSALFVLFLYSASLVDMLRIVNGSLFTISESFISIFRNAVYISVFILMLLCLLRNKKSAFDFLSISLVYVFLLLTSLLINSDVIPLVLNNLLMVFSRIIPSFILAKHCDISSFLKYLHRSSIVLLLYAGLFVAFGVGSSRYYYMNVGYNILFPSLLLLFYRKNWLDVCISLFSLVINLFYCARGSIIVAVFSIVFFFIVYLCKKRNGFLYAFLGLAIFALIIYFSPSIIRTLYEIMPTSRTLFYLTSNRMFDSSGRDIFYLSGLAEIFNNPFEIRGLLGDRIFYSTYLNLSSLSDIEGAFAHNIFIEISLQYGLLAGIVLMIVFLFLLVKPLIILLIDKNYSKDHMAVYCALVIPCFIIAMTTSSLLSNFESMLMLGLCLNMIRKRDEKKRYAKTVRSLDNAEIVLMQE